MEPDSRVVLKDLWFDQINSRQIAINAEIAVTGYAFDKQSRDLIQMASVKERQGRDGTEPGIIVYVAKEGDSVWKVAKRYHAPVSWIRSVNDLADHEEIKAGAKVLIVR
jgi:LysM repeat protein